MEWSGLQEKVGALAAIPTLIIQGEISNCGNVMPLGALVRHRICRCA